MLKRPSMADPKIGWPGRHRHPTHRYSSAGGDTAWDGDDTIEPGLDCRVGGQNPGTMTILTAQYCFSSFATFLASSARTA